MRNGKGMVKKEKTPRQSATKYLMKKINAQRLSYMEYTISMVEMAGFLLNRNVI